MKSLRVIFCCTLKLKFNALASQMRENILKVLDALKNELG